MNDSDKPPSICGQCGRPAIVSLNGVLLCVDCEYKYQQSRYLVFVQAATMMNHADREMAIATGMPELMNQMPIPRAPVPPIHYNNQTVSVTGGTVGSINFGNVNEIRVDVDTLTQNGAVSQAEALVAVTNSILETEELNEAQKNALLEQVAFLTKQATLPANERKPGVVKSILSGIKEGAGPAGAVANAWSSAEPIIKGFFGLS